MRKSHHIAIAEKRTLFQISVQALFQVFKRIHTGMASLTGFIVLPFFLFSLPALAGSAAGLAPSPDEIHQVQVRELLRTRLEAARIERNLRVADEPIYSQTTLPAFYTNRGFDTAWTGSGSPLAKVDSLISAIRAAYHEGLNPDDYHLAIIEQYAARARGSTIVRRVFEPGLLVDIELLCTDAYLILASHYTAGKVDPATFDNHWRANRREIDLAVYLESAIQTGQIGRSLNDLLPVHAGYDYLRDALHRYRQIEDDGGWPAVQEGPLLRKGEQNKRVPQLRQRLLLAGDYPGPADTTNSEYDDALETAVKKFQYRHGLEPDGVIGPATNQALNTPVRDRIIAAELNMERWRWLPLDIGERHIIVNIAGFDVRVIESGETVMQMRAVVGRQYRQTPVFSGRMTYLVFSPFWHVPPTIAGNDVLPQVQRDVEYLRSQNMKVFQGWGADTREVDPATVDWNTVSRRNMPYRFRQDPGPTNALGTVKFMFPNPYHVYLHDSPARDLFGRAQRDFSSGCIRVEKPLELAEYLLMGTRWTRSEILAAMQGTSERTVTLPSAMPVHLQYWTAWAERDGTIHFRNDIYQRDGRLLEALRAVRPGINPLVRETYSGEF